MDLFLCDKFACRSSDTDEKAEGVMMKRIFFFAALLLALFAPRHSEAQLAFDLSASTCTLTAGANQVHTEGGTCGGTSDGSLIRLTDAPSAGGCTGTPGTTARLCIYDASQDALLASSSGNVEALSTVGASGTAPVSNGSGGVAMTDIATQAELDAEITARHPREFLVSDYGTISDDGLQDHSSINAAVDAACAAGGGAVILVSGEIYDIGSTTASAGINLRCSNLALLTPAGQPPAKLRPISTYAATSYMIMAGERSSSGGAPTNTSQLDNISISNIAFETPAPSAYRNVGIYVQWVKDIAVDRIWCNGLGEACIYGYGLYVSGTRKQPENVRVTNIFSSDTPSYQGHGAIAVIRFDSFVGLTIDGVTCDNTQTMYYYADAEVGVAACVRFGETQSTLPSSSVRVKNLTCRDAFYACIFDGSITGLGVSDVVITDSTFENQCSYCAVFGSDDNYVSVSDGWVFSHNTARGNLFNFRNLVAEFRFKNSIFADNTAIDGSSYTGTEAGTSTSSTMEETGAAHSTNEWVGYWLECTSSTCADQKIRVIANDGDTFFLGSSWSGGTPNNVTFRLMYDSYVALNDATASGGTTTSLVDSGAGWATDQWIGWWLDVVAGTCNGKRFPIASNTADTLIPVVDGSMGCSPDATTVYDIQNSPTETAGSAFMSSYNAVAGNIYNKNIISNFAGPAFSIAAGGNTISNNIVSNTGLNGSACLVSSGNTAYNIGSWGILGNTATCDAAASGAIAADWPDADQLVVADNILSGTALGTAIDAYSTVMRGNSINGFVTGMKPRRSVSLVSNNYVTAAGDSISIEGSVFGTVIMGNAMGTGVNEQDSANYSAMVGNFSMAGGIECHTLNGGVGANDICLGNVGMKDVLSPSGAQITSGTEPPGSCTDGEIFQDTDAATGTQLMSCESGVFVTQ